METLKLTIKKKWFDMILSGEKPEEYREVKPYWGSRLSRLFPLEYQGVTFVPIVEAIEFYNGGHFSERLPHFAIEFKGAEKRTGNPMWGAEPEKEYYVIKLGKVISKRNIS